MPVDTSNPIHIAGSAVSNVLSTAKAVVSGIPTAQLFVTSIIGLVLAFILIALIVFLFFYARPVIPSPCHSSNFDEFMDGSYYPDFVATLKTFSVNCMRYAPNALASFNSSTPATSRFSPAWTNTQSIPADASTAASSLLSLGDLVIQKNLKVYFTHFRCFASRNDLPYSMFCGSAFSSNPDFCSSTGGRVVDMAKVVAFENDIVKKFETLRNACKTISAAAEALGDVSRLSWYDATAFQWIMSAHKLRLYLNEYHDQINESAMSRTTDKWAINTWILFYIPVVNDIIRFRIPEVWAAVPSMFIKFMNLWKVAWSKLGNVIINIPCNMIYTGDKRRQYCNTKIF